MAQKFIITQQGYFRLGDVKLHKHLLELEDTCYGGGFWQIDYLSNRLLLEGASYDYGKPKWELLINQKKTLKIPLAYQGMQIIYYPEYAFSKELIITEQLQTEYI